MQLVSKIYPDKFLNADDEVNVLGEGEILNAVNMRFSSTDEGATGRWENILSNAEIANTYLSSGTNINIGLCSSDDSHYVILFNYNSNGDHGIYAYRKTDNTFYKVLLNSQITGGLNFNKDNLITSRIIGSRIYFTDNLNEPRRLNIESGIKLNHPSFTTPEQPYTSPLSPEVITIIRRPPNYPLSISKKLASSVGITINTNLIKDNAFRFTYFFTDWNGEETTLAEHSLLAPYNYSGDNFDVIEVKVPFSQIIDQYVQKITLAVIYADTNQAFEIKTWDKTNSTDLTSINNHNSLTTQLTYYFTNNEVGSAIDSQTLDKPFESIALVAKCLERSNSRLFLGNLLMGYSTPQITSLTGTVTTITSGGTTINGYYDNIFYTITGNPSDPDTPTILSVYYVYFPTAVDGSHPAGYYILTSVLPGLWQSSTVPTSPINLSDYTYVGADASSDVMSFTYGNSTTVLGYTPTSIALQSEFNAGAVSTSGTVGASNRSILKSDSARRIGIVFYDKYMRQCGVVIANSGLITIPDRAYNFSTTYNYAIQWTLNNTNALNEIPSWAYYYSIVSTKDLIRQSFVQAQAGDIKYATKDSTGAYVIPASSTTYAETNAGVALKLDKLNGYGLGYSYSKGDIIKVYTSTSATVYKLSVIDVVDGWVIGSLANLGSLSGVNALFEIYTPGAPSASQFYYEQGNIYPVSFPGNSIRAYSVLTGTIEGDIYILSRGTSPSTYIIEAMSPNDNYWQNWLTSAGRIQVVDKIGQQKLKTAIRWSRTLIDGTRTNGLSSFDALNQKLLSHELDEINKLQLANKVDEQGQGNVMLAICPTDTASMYMGEVQLMGAAQAGDIATTDNVIGSVNVLKGSFGTIHPESVVEFKGDVWWFDALSGRFVQYSVNGLDDISCGDNDAFKFSRVAKLLANKILSMTTSDIESLGSRPFVFGGVDPYHKEVYWTVPQLGSPPKGVLSDYVVPVGTSPSYIDAFSYASGELLLESVLYPYDILDFQNKTFVYKIYKRWLGSFSWKSEGFTILDSTLYSVKSGKLYQHNVSGSYNNFYGTQYRSKIALVCNKDNTVKEFQTVAVEGSQPEWSHFRTEEPFEQSSDLIASDFENKEGVYYSPVYRDRLTPNASSFTQAQISGDEMRTKALRCMVQWNSNQLIYFRTISFGYNQSTGHY